MAKSRSAVTWQVLIDQEAGDLLDGPDLLVGHGSGGIGQSRQRVFPREVVLLHDIFERQAPCKLAQQEVAGHSGPLNDRLSEKDLFVYSDSRGYLDHLGLSSGVCHDGHFTTAATRRPSQTTTHQVGNVFQPGLGGSPSTRHPDED